ncbi:hypothetical protein CCAX7_33020 [Capsulimonas corticalis]|uniref:Uncharacterized protein n=1 Tax=Capsulimonas corticalis TaxID=2219043 RepID=A0A402CYM3_9BACT|nr:hypothetical protein [Capsulimonas corticalis]BDI31251.1 hypothetical protein CCAX7_33020 [Capsulimonas corticalis]
MRLTRITPLVVAIIGSVLTIAAIVLIVFFLIQPIRQQTDAASARLDAAVSGGGTQHDVQTAKADLVLANKQALATRQAWHVKEVTLMPPFDVSKRYSAWRQLSHELSENLGPSLERWMARSGVVQLSSISIAPPPSSPNDITGAPLVIPVSGSDGAMSVEGDFRRILAHLVKWNDFNRLVMIDKVELHGNSPFMQCKYNASVIIFPQNPTTVDKPVTSAGTGAPGGGAGGFGGRGPGGYPGAPGGGGYPGGPGGGYPGARGGGG